MKVLEINPYLESMKLILSIVKKESLKNDAKKLYEEFSDDPKVYEAFSAGIEAENAVIRFQFNRKNSLFLRIDGGEDTYADFLIDSYVNIIENISPQKYLLKEFKEDQGKKFLESILDVEIKNENNTGKIIMNSKLSDKTKLEIYEIMLDFELMITDFCFIVEKVKQIIEPILKKYHLLYENMERFINDNTDAVIFDRFHIRGKETNSEDIEILPIILCCNEVSFKDDKQFMIGILFTMIDVFHKRLFSPDELANTIKILGDQINISILKYLNEGPLYQTQLANYLNVSKPVINYHVQQLISHNVLQLDVKGKKVFVKKDDNMIEFIFNEYISFINKRKD